MELLAKINKELETTIVQVTHSMENAKYGNKIIKIFDGKIIQE
jgi:putative ABC transport system ATP-binding protein